MTIKEFEKAQEVMKSIKEQDEIINTWNKLAKEIKNGTSYIDNKLYFQVYTGEKDYRLWMPCEIMQETIKKVVCGAEQRKRNLEVQLEKI